MKIFVCPLCILAVVAMVALNYFRQSTNPTEVAISGQNYFRAKKFFPRERAGLDVAPAPLPTATASDAVNMLRTAFRGEKDPNSFFQSLRNQFENRLRNDPDFVAGVLETMKTEMDPDFFGFLAKEMARNAASPELKTSMETIAFDRSDTSERRQIALEILGGNFPPDSELLRSVANLAQKDADPRVRSGAVNALDLWLKHPDQLQGFEGQIVQSLVEIINTSSDETLWARGLRALNGQGARISLEVLQALPNLMEHGATPENRQLAAATLALADDAGKDFALGQLERGFLRETDAATRQFIAVQMVTLNAGRTATIERIEQLAPNDTALLLQMKDAYVRVQMARAEP